MTNHCKVNAECPKCGSGVKTWASYQWTNPDYGNKKLSLELDVLTITIKCRNCGLEYEMNLEQMEAE